MTELQKDAHIEGLEVMVVVLHDEVKALLNANRTLAGQVQMLNAAEDVARLQFMQWYMAVDAEQRFRSMEELILQYRSHLELNQSKVHTPKRKAA